MSSVGGSSNNNIERATRRQDDTASEAATQKAQEAARLQEAAKVQDAAPAGDFVEGLEQAEHPHVDPATVDGARARALGGEGEAKARLLQPREPAAPGPRRGLRPDEDWQARAGGSTRPVPRPPPPPTGSTRQVNNDTPNAPADPNQTKLA